MKIITELKTWTGLDRPTLFLSDFHLGAGGLADDSRPDAVRRFLGTIPADWRIVLLGDVLELWQFGQKDVERRNSMLLGELRERGALWIQGNHDWAMRGVQRREGWRCGNVFAEHGHQADLLNYRASWFGRAATWLCGVMERLGWQVDDDWAKLEREMKRMMRPTARPHDHVPYFEHARMRLREVGCSIYIFGHTHEPLLVQDKKSGVVFGNCGDWVRNATAIFALPDAIRLVEERISFPRETSHPFELVSSEALRMHALR